MGAGRKRLEVPLKQPPVSLCWLPVPQVLQRAQLKRQLGPRPGGAGSGGALDMLRREVRWASGGRWQPACGAGRALLLPLLSPHTCC